MVRKAVTLADMVRAVSKILRYEMPSSIHNSVHSLFAHQQAHGVSPPAAGPSHHYVSRSPSRAASRSTRYSPSITTSFVIEKDDGGRFSIDASVCIEGDSRLSSIRTLWIPSFAAFFALPSSYLKRYTVATLLLLIRDRRCSRSMYVPVWNQN